MLANNASSDPVPFTLYEYSAVARNAPPLADGLTCLDLVRMTLDRYLSGVKGYGQVGYACTPSEADLVPWPTPWTSLDTLPSLLISACDYAQGARDWNWARENYEKLAAWGREMMAADKDGNGLIEYPGTGNYGDRPLANKRPSNWWDTINFGHEDAFANALAYRAFDRIVAVSEAIAAEMRARGVPGDKVRVIQNGLDYGELDAQAQQREAKATLRPGDDVLNGARFADTIGINAWPIERHAAGRVEWAFPRDERNTWNQLPWRMLLPTGVANLLVAGRCASMEHEGQSAARASGVARRRAKADDPSILE